MNTVVARNVVIGEGSPKICASIIGRTQEEIRKQACRMMELPVDIVEWRADFYEDGYDFDRVKKTLAGIRKIIKEKPVLFTIRTAKEGGEKFIERNDYIVMNKAIIQAGDADLIDVELFTGEVAVKKLIAVAHHCQVKVIVSNHDFEKTPDQEEIINRLCKMQELGSDISKIAVMPQTKTDVLTLLAATEEMYRKYADRPIITMSMGKEGMISRLCGEVFGSAVTFGAVNKVSAPGQMEVEELAQVLALLHKNI